MYITELQSFKVLRVFFLILFKICGGTLRIMYLSIVNHSLNNTTFIDIACLLTKDLYIFRYYEISPDTNTLSQKEIKKNNYSE